MTIKITNVNNEVYNVVSICARNHFKKFGLVKNDTTLFVKLNLYDFVLDEYKILSKDESRLDLSKKDFLNDIIDNCSVPVSIAIESKEIAL